MLAAAVLLLLSGSALAQKPAEVNGYSKSAMHYGPMLQSRLRGAGGRPARVAHKCPLHHTSCRLPD